MRLKHKLLLEEQLTKIKIKIKIKKSTNIICMCFEVIISSLSIISIKIQL